MKKRIIMTILVIAGSFISTHSIVVAQTCPNTPCASNETCLGGYCVAKPDGLRPEFTQASALGFILSLLYKYILPLIGVVGFIFFLWSGVQYLTSKGDPKGLAAAQARLTYAIVGLIIIFLAYSLTIYITGLFGLVTP